jgi:hypothetical protein
MPEVTQSFLDDLTAARLKAERRAENLSQALKQARIKARKAAPEPDPPEPTKAKAAPDSDLARQLAEANAKLAAVAHRDTFRAAAIAKGANAKDADKLYKILDLAPGDAPAKPEDFHAALDAAKEADPWAFASSPSTPPQGKQGTPPTAPPPGSGRSASTPPVSRVEYRDDEVTRPGWQQARPDLVEAFAKGNAVRVEG